MMSWNPAFWWLLLALILGLAELASGALVLLALAVAALVTAAVAATGFDLTIQLLAMGVLAGVLVPLAIWKIRPRFSPRGVRYGTTGTGVEKGRVYVTERRDFDDATGIKINGDFYRLRLSDTGESELLAGTQVIFEQFDGTTAVVRRKVSKAPSQS